MPTMRVLVIEDDHELATEVAAGLRHSRMAVDVAFNGRDGLSRATVFDYDVIVPDRDLPGVDGDQVCARLVAERRRSRVLMLTAAASSADLVRGLGLGADDYLPKPFEFEVLVARIRALARRAQPPIPPVLRCGDVALDAARRSALRAGRDLGLSPKEFGVLELLLSTRGAACRPRNCLRASGTKPPIRSRTPSKSPGCRSFGGAYAGVGMTPRA
jgi:DNA-binding response OmpR family regulator